MSISRSPPVCGSTVYGRRSLVVLSNVRDKGLRDLVNQTRAYCRAGNSQGRRNRRGGPPQGRQGTDRVITTRGHFTSVLGTRSAREHRVSTCQAGHKGRTDSRATSGTSHADLTRRRRTGVTRVTTGDLRGTSFTHAFQRQRGRNINGAGHNGRRQRHTSTTRDRLSTPQLLFSLLAHLLGQKDLVANTLSLHFGINGIFSILNIRRCLVMGSLTQHINLNIPQCFNIRHFRVISTRRGTKDRHVVIINKKVGSARRHM